MKKAYVIHQKFQDLERVALKVDEVVPIIKGKVNPFIIDELWSSIRRSVTPVDTARDYIVPAGNTLVNFLAGLAVGLRRPKKVKLMIHDATTGFYRELVLILEEEAA